MKLWIATTVAMALGGSLSAQVPTATVPHHAVTRLVLGNTPPGGQADRSQGRLAPAA